jgi:hypothetical protein
MKACIKNLKVCMFAITGPGGRNRVDCTSLGLINDCPTVPTFRLHHAFDGGKYIHVNWDVKI